MEITIRKIDPGEIITEPGFYDMPLSFYHDDCCDGPSVSSSGLRQIALESPLHYWDRSYLNPDRDPDDVSEIEAEHFRIGRAAHLRMLEPERFKANIAVRPDIWDSWRTKDSQAWLKDHQREGYTVMTDKEMLRVEGIAKALSGHNLHRDGILGGLVEISMIVKDKKTGIWMKSRPDAIPNDTAFTDLKTVADASPRVFERNAKALGYDMQLALAGVCLFGLTERTIDQFYLVPVESKRPHAIHVATLTPGQVYQARCKLRGALDTMAKCLESNYWPSFGEDGRGIAPTEYEAKEFKQSQKAGLIPEDDDF